MTATYFCGMNQLLCGPVSQFCVELIAIVVVVIVKSVSTVNGYKDTSSDVCPV